MVLCNIEEVNMATRRGRIDGLMMLAFAMVVIVVIIVAKVHRRLRPPKVLQPVTIQRTERIDTAKMRSM